VLCCVPVSLLCHGKNHFQVLGNWLSAYALYARILCERRMPLDRYNSVFSNKPKRRGIWYLPEEHSKEGADIPVHFMLVKTLLNPFRLVRAVFVMAQYIVMWPLCFIVNFPFRTQRDANIHPKQEHPYLFLTTFTLTIGLFDVACDFVLKPLEGLIYILDVTYDVVLPLIGKTLMSPVIFLYACYSLCYIVNQGFHHLFKPEEEVTTAPAAQTDEQAKSTLRDNLTLNDNPALYQPVSGTASSLAIFDNLTAPGTAKDYSIEDAPKTEAVDKQNDLLKNYNLAQQTPPSPHSQTS